MNPKQRLQKKTEIQEFSIFGCYSVFRIQSMVFARSLECTTCFRQISSESRRIFAEGVPYRKRSLPVAAKSAILQPGPIRDRTTRRCLDRNQGWPLRWLSRRPPGMPDRRGNEISKGLPKNVSHRRELSWQLKNISGPSGSSGSQIGICASERLQVRIRADRNRVFFPVFLRLARWSGCGG